MQAPVLKKKCSNSAIDNDGPKLIKSRIFMVVILHFIAEKAESNWLKKQ